MKLIKDKHKFFRRDEYKYFIIEWCGHYDKVMVLDIRDRGKDVKLRNMVLQSSTVVYNKFDKIYSEY